MTNINSGLSRLIQAHEEASKPGKKYWASQARQTVADLLAVSETLGQEFSGIRHHSDPKLSAEGLRAAQEAMKADLRSRVTEAARSAVEVAGRALVAAEKAAAPFRPTYDAADVAQLTRTEQAWRMAVQPKLDAGEAWPEIVATLDHDGLLAVQRFAPMYESAKRDRFTQNEVPAVIDQLQRLTDARVVDTAPEGTPRDAMRELVDVRRLHEAAINSAAALSRVENERDVVGVSVAVKREAFAAGANPAAMAEDATAA